MQFLLFVFKFSIVINLAYLYMLTKGFSVSYAIENQKELIVYDQLNSNDIGYKMASGSIAHLSNQSKKISGLALHILKRSKYATRVL
jgi:hypothetical protein